MNKKMLTLSLPFALLCSCGNFKSEIEQMKGLQEKIEKQFNFKEVTIKEKNGSSLEVSVLNSSYNDSSDDVKQRIADSIGAVSSDYIHSAKLTSGTVSFVKNNNYGVVNTTKGQTFAMHLK